MRFRKPRPRRVLLVAGAALGVAALAIPTAAPTATHMILAAAGGNSNGNQGNGNGNGGPDGTTFLLSATLPTTMQPDNVARPVDIQIDNPYSFGITITDIKVVSPLTIQPAVSGCVAAGNFTTTNYTGTSFPIAKNGTFKLSTSGIAQAKWPQITMLSSTANQDRCQGAAYHIAYQATAVQ